MRSGYALYKGRFSKRISVRSAITGTLLFILCMAVALAPHGVKQLKLLKNTYALYRTQLEEIDVLQQTVKDRDEQLDTLTDKLHVMETRLAEITQLENKLRDLAGVEKSAEGPFSYGGGSGGEMIGIDPEDTEWHNPENLARYLSERLEQLSESTLKQSRNLQGLYRIFKTQQEILTVTPSIRPVDDGWVSSGFGYRKSPFSGRKEYHTGVDIAVTQGTPVRATANGIVNFAGSRGGFGKMLVIDHGFGITSRYAHLNKILTSKDRNVKKGEVIAETGNTGRSTGPHLHYEVRFNGIPMNATKYMSRYLAENTDN